MIEFLLVAGMVMLKFAFYVFRFVRELTAHLPQSYLTVFRSFRSNTIFSTPHEKNKELCSCDLLHLYLRFFIFGICKFFSEEIC